jgi:ABC-2 type transport system permease protein
MNKTWLIAKHDYLETVKKKSFLLITVGMPLLLAGIMAIMFFLLIRRISEKPVGYVDQANVLNPPSHTLQTVGLERLFTFQYYPDEEAARKALFEEEIQAYYVLPEYYAGLREVTLYYLDEEPSPLTDSYFQKLIQMNLAQGLPAQVQARILDGFHLTIRSADGRREFGSGHYGSFFFSMLSAFFFYTAAMSTSGYMTKAMAIEKENRTMETLLLSASPGQIIRGKILGLSAVSLTQLLIFNLPLLISLPVISAQMPQLRTWIEIPWELPLVAALYFLPTYLLLVNLLLAIGVSESETDQSSLLASLLSLLFNLPLLLIPFIFSAPNHPFLVALTLLPPCAFMAVILRWSLAAIPTWQLLVSWGLLMGTAFASTWVVSRIFRATMLAYGQKFTLKNLAAALRTP